MRAFMSDSILRGSTLNPPPIRGCGHITAWTSIEREHMACMEARRILAETEARHPSNEWLMTLVPLHHVCGPRYQESALVADCLEFRMGAALAESLARFIAEPSL